jgi:hypothetical protein
MEDERRWPETHHRAPQEEIGGDQESQTCGGEEAELERRGSQAHRGGYEEAVGRGLPPCDIVMADIAWDTPDGRVNEFVRMCAQIETE